MHSKEFIAVGGGFSVKDPATGTVTEVINDDGTLNSGAVIDAGSVTAAKLATDAVETLKIKDLNVTAGKLAADAVETAKIKDANVTLAKLAAIISPSHVIKFLRLGSTITTTALVGLVVGDLVIRFIAADSTVTAKLCAVTDTLPDDPADADYIVVLRATA
jgi:hypothetical protein